MRSDACLLLFAKPPRAGGVKTRLVHDRLSPARAAELYEAFLRDLSERLEGGSFDSRIVWAKDGAEAIPRGLPAGRLQQGDDLGERLFRGLADAAADHELVAAVGGDHPDLPLARLDEAFATLRRGRSMVLGPSHDGGYYLIGLRAEAVDRRLFSEIAWSTAGVLRATLARARELGLEPALLAQEADVDRPADLELLVERLENGREAPRTAALLRAWGWMAGAA